MNFLQAAILLLLGTVLLVIGIRAKSKDEDAMTTLKGLAVFRRDIDALKDQASRSEAKSDLVQRELMLLRNEIHECKTTLAARASEPKKSKGVFETRYDAEPDPIPEKYRAVMALAQQGLPVADIARKMALSQDAVAMILNMYKRA